MLQLRILILRTGGEGTLRICIFNKLPGDVDTAADPAHILCSLDLDQRLSTLVVY